MLFDLRSRGRRRTVQAVYLGLALIMAGGLIFFGVGAGNGFGGLLNAFTGNGSSSGQKQVVSQAEKTALRETRLNPNSPTAWSDLVQARWTNANQGSNYDSTNGTFTTAGKHELAAVAVAWQHYINLTKKANPDVAILASRAYGQRGNYAAQAAAWEQVTLADPTEVKGFECLAAAAYAAKQTRKGDLAAAKAESLTPKASRAQVKLELSQAKSSPQFAQTSC
jgi:hypothetical protein